jgi:hypothetical protein
VVPLFFHVVTAFCLIGIVAAVDLPSGVCRGDVLMWTIKIFSFCPIAFFCSQKFWIDNCAMMSTAVSAYFHVAVNNANAGNFGLVVRYVLSGIVFGLVALNTKLSNLALFPFLILWSIAQLVQRKQCNLWKVVLCAISLLVGAAVGHLPWIYIYHVRHS